jgi:catechol 2,3-dioxygenase-like lactoylglutathione lyase family enzyme
VTDQLARTRFTSAAELASGLEAYRQVYLHHIPQRALGHITPHAALLAWFEKQPELFRVDPHNHPGLDTYIVLVQTPPEQIGAGYHRRRTGLNHIAFQVESREAVDDLTAQLRERGVTVLYEDRHPYAGGGDSLRGVHRGS